MSRRFPPAVPGPPDSPQLGSPNAHALSLSPSLLRTSSPTQQPMPQAIPRPLPTHTELAALGPVLCLFCERYGGELAGWSRAAQARAHGGIDSDGWYEYIAFADADSCDCWRLYLLPDSDFFAWECMRERLPQHAAALSEPTHSPSVPSPRAASFGRACARSTRWRASVVRLHALRSHMPEVLAVSPWPVSALGAEMVRSVLRREGIREPPASPP